MILKNLISGGGNKKATIMGVSGQSNGEGVVLLSSLPEQYRGVRNRVKIWWEGAFENMEAGVNTVNEIHRGEGAPADSDSYQWCLEQSASYLLERYLNRDVYVIKNALGSQNIQQWDFPSGAMWLELKAQVEGAIEELETAGKTPEFKSWCWLQGEANVISVGLTKAEYKSKLIDLISNWRALAPEYLTDTPFVIFKMRSGSVTNGGGESRLQELNDAFQEIADADPTRVKIIDPDLIGASIADIGDGVGGGVHYPWNGYLIIGEEWYNTMI